VPDAPRRPSPPRATARKSTTPAAAKKGRANANHKAIPRDQAKARVLELIQAGHTVPMAMKAVDRSESAYRVWRDEDPKFRERLLQIRELHKAQAIRSGGEIEVPDFPEFCEIYLHQPLPEHHLRVWDVINGREPRTLHPSMRFQQGRPNFVILNFPPEHAKSTVWTAGYTTWRILKDHSTSGAIISAKQEMAKQFLYQVKQRLEHPDYHELQAAFAPEGGFRGESWREDRFYLSGRRGEGKDPTLQALGIRSKIYGARLKFITLDDCVDLSNASDWEAQHRWLGQEVITRLPPEGGHIFIIGTRVAPVDLYMKLREQNETVWVAGEPLERRCTRCCRSPRCWSSRPRTRTTGKSSGRSTSRAARWRRRRARCPTLRRGRWSTSSRTCPRTPRSPARRWRRPSITPAWRGR
jgi:hypothetical protein